MYILVEAAGGVALVRAVEERDEPARLEDRGDLPPP